jgi:hypothetical protein
MGDSIAGLAKLFAPKAAPLRPSRSVAWGGDTHRLHENADKPPQNFVLCYFLGSPRAGGELPDRPRKDR